MTIMNANRSFGIFSSVLQGLNLIEASAGTGKTWNICWLFVRLLIEKKLAVRDILVVTFTNAATAELRERIRGRLVDVRDHLCGKTSASPDPFVTEFIKHLATQAGYDPNKVKDRIDLALQSFDEAAIYTIHGFCQRALTDSAFASGQTFAQELMPDDSELRMEAVHDFWRRHIASDGLGRNLASYLISKRDTPESFAAELKRRLSKPLASYLWPPKPESAPDIQALSDAYAAAKMLWESQRKIITDRILSSLDRLNKQSYKPSSVKQAADHYDNYFRAHDPLAPEPEKSRLHLMRTSTLEEKATGKLKSPPNHEFFDLAETLFTLKKSVDDALEIARLALLEKMLNELPVTLEEKKRTRRVLSFDDILSNLHTALTGGMYPWLAVSLRVRYPAALVDEFQDTDPLQFDIFKTIYADHDKPLFLVGDPKQAIYRFRNADLNTYFQAKNLVLAKCGEGALHTISDNQRSSPELIAALNQLYTLSSQPFKNSGLSYLSAGIGTKPRARFADDERSRPSHAAHLQVWQLPNEDAGRIKKAQLTQRVSQATAGEIAQLLNAAHDGKVTLDETPLHARNIAVLVRSHKQGSAIKRALTALGIGSVELSQTSVFASTDAEEVERVLAAIWSPMKTGLLRAALATGLIGFDALQIDTFSSDEAVLSTRMQEFADYRDTWMRRGIGFLYREILRKEKVSFRILRRSDGERRMTNLLHLGELLHEASSQHPSPDALLRWLQNSRKDASAEESAQLRLESDQNLVHILTIHKAKGLEYPIVFCPFLWNVSQHSSKLAGREYHDDDDRTVIDFRPDSAKDASITEKIKRERDAEDLRLIYVALTRAVHRCYLVAGCYLSRGTTGESERSLLNSLLGEDKLSATQIEIHWETLAAESKGNISILPLPQGRTAPVTPEMTKPEMLECRKLPAAIPRGWRITSFSGLKRNAVHDNAASERDLFLSDPLRREGAPPRHPDRTTS